MEATYKIFPKLKLNLLQTKVKQIIMTRLFMKEVMVQTPTIGECIFNIGDRARTGVCALKYICLLFFNIPDGTR